MIARFRNWLYNAKDATRRLKVATVAMRCDREPAANRYDQENVY